MSTMGRPAKRSMGIGKQKDRRRIQGKGGERDVGRGNKGLSKAALFPHDASGNGHE